MSNILFYMLLQYHTNYTAPMSNARAHQKESFSFFSLTLIDIELNKHLPPSQQSTRTTHTHTFYNEIAKYQPPTNNKLNVILKTKISLRHKHVVMQLKATPFEFAPSTLHNIPIIVLSVGFFSRELSLSFSLL